MRWPARTSSGRRVRSRLRGGCGSRSCELRWGSKNSSRCHEARWTACQRASRFVGTRRAATDRPTKSSSVLRDETATPSESPRSGDSKTRLWIVQLRAALGIQELFSMPRGPLDCLPAGFAFRRDAACGLDHPTKSSSVLRDETATPTNRRVRETRRRGCGSCSCELRAGDPRTLLDATRPAGLPASGLRVSSGTAATVEHRATPGERFIPYLRALDGLTLQVPVVRTVVQERRERTHRREPEEIGDRNLPSARALQPTLHLHGQQRVPAEIEEVVVAADIRRLQHLAPDAGDRRLELALRRLDFAAHEGA